MDLMGLCNICGKPSNIFTCHLCGNMVCNNCYDKLHNICKKCSTSKL